MKALNSIAAGLCGVVAMAAIVVPAWSSTASTSGLTPATTNDPVISFTYKRLIKGEIRDYENVDELFRLDPQNRAGSFLRQFSDRYDAITRDYHLQTSNPRENLDEIIGYERTLKCEKTADVPASAKTDALCIELTRGFESNAEVLDDIEAAVIKDSQPWTLSGMAFFDAERIITPFLRALPLHSGEKTVVVSSTDLIRLERYRKGSRTYIATAEDKDLNGTFDEIIFSHPYEPTVTIGENHHRVIRFYGHGLLVQGEPEVVEFVTSAPMPALERIADPGVCILATIARDRAAAAQRFLGSVRDRIVAVDRALVSRTSR